MAIILKTGAARSGTASATLPLRSTTIKILQTGLIDKIVNEKGAAVGNVNLGYMGDNKVSRIYVELWKNSTSFVGYEAALVFYNLKTGTRNTLSMAATSPNFSLDIPEQITLQPNNYQIYFILRESISSTTTGSGAIGEEDDPAYREVFVSDVVTGSVEYKSGRQYISKDFDWEKDIYNYNIGTVAIDDKTWIKNNSSYSTEIYLGGLNNPNASVVVQPTEPKETDINIQYNSKEIESVTGSIDNENKTLMITATFISEATETQIEQGLDQLKISYPVNFSAEYTNSLKTPIKVINTPNSLNVENNNRLGMKHDAYITPIDVSGLIEPKEDASDVVNKYVIFAQQSVVYVCKAFGTYCWIPVGITNRSGLWSVSFVSRNETKGYIYYTGTLSLPVTDNALFKEDIITDSTYSVVLDLDGNYIYDDNDYVLYAQSEEQGTVHLEFAGNTINKILGWVDGLASPSSYDNTTIINDMNWVEDIAATYPSQTVKEKLAQVNTLSNDFNALKDQVENADVTDMRNDVTELQSQVSGENGLVDRMGKAEQDVNKLQQDVDKLEADLAAADVSVLTNRVQEAENKINQLSENDTKIRNDFAAADSTLKQSIENDYKAADAALASRITMINSTDAEQSSKIAEHGGKIAALESKDVDLQAQIGKINTTLSNYGTFTTALTQEIENRTRADEQFKQQIENIYIQDEFTKAEAGVLVEKENQLRQELQTETARAEAVEQSLSNTINNEIQRAEAAEEQIAQNLTNVDTALKQRLDLIDGEEGSINNLQSQIQSNDKDIADIQQFNSNQQTSIEENTTAISSIKESLATSVVQNDYEVGVDKTYVAAIKFIKPDIENNLTAEQVYEALVAAGQIDKNTLYLIQEEE